MKNQINLCGIKKKFYAFKPYAKVSSTYAKPIKTYAEPNKLIQNLVNVCRIK